MEKEIETLRLITYDTEVFKHNWIVVFKDKETGSYTVIHNDNEALRECISDDNIYIGFNTKHYDQYIIKGICAGFTPEELKRLNDYLIGGFQGWQYPDLQGFFFKFNNVDIRDDMYNALSLKAIEGHIGMDIEESEIDFNIDRPLTQEELEQTIHYCKHDVDATEKLVELRRDYLKNKINIGNLAGIDGTKALGMTNAKLTAAMLGARRREYKDEREYVYPSNLKREYIPQEVFEFFDRLYDKDIPDEEVFKEKLKFSIGRGEGVIGYGGIHLAIPNYMWKESGDE